MNHSDTDKISLAERIHKRQDLEKLTVHAVGDWKIDDFRAIPMGWSAVIRNEKSKITIWSHRCEIEVEEFIDGQWKRSEILNYGWTLKDSDIYIVSKVLENSMQK